MESVKITYSTAFPCFFSVFLNVAGTMCVVFDINLMTPLRDI